jgi:hypothetical protein
MRPAQTPLEAEARQRIAERVARSAIPRVPAVPARHRLAVRLRRVADRLES